MRERSEQDDAVSEVISQILVFAIVTGVFILSMVAFKAAQQGTADRVAAVRADSAAARVAAAVVQAGVLSEEQGQSVRVRFLIDLPPDLDGLAYQVSLKAGGTETATIEVAVPSRGIKATAPLFAIEAQGDVRLCPTPSPGVPGGLIYARYSHPAPDGGATPCIFLEAAT